MIVCSLVVVVGDDNLKAFVCVLAALQSSCLELVSVEHSSPVFQCSPVHSLLLLLVIVPSHAVGRHLITKGRSTGATIKDAGRQIWEHCLPSCTFFTFLFLFLKQLTAFIEIATVANAAGDRLIRLVC